MVYASYEYYAGVYGGTMAVADFVRLARAASAQIDAMTFGRAARVTDEGTLDKLRDACCAVADLLRAEEQGGEVLSAENDGYRETYAASGRSFAQRRYEAMALYLANTGLLYAGCGRSGFSC